MIDIERHDYSLGWGSKTLETLRTNYNGNHYRFHNIAFGHASLYKLSEGIENICLGKETNYKLPNGNGTVSIGARSQLNTIISGQTSLGFESLFSNISGVKNTAIGYKNLRTNEGSNNTAVGNEADCQGDSNSLMGANANAVGNENVIMGANANAVGNENVIMGANANADGNENVIMGANANADGNENVIMGANANVDGNGNILLKAKDNTIHLKSNGDILIQTAGCTIEYTDSDKVTKITSDKLEVNELVPLKDILPKEDSVINLGNVNSKFLEVFAKKATINVSDGRFKKDIDLVDDKVLMAWKKVKLKQYRLNGDNGKLCFGYIIQDIIEAFESESLNVLDYDLLILDNPLGYCLRYNEAFALEIECISRGFK